MATAKLILQIDPQFNYAKFQTQISAVKTAFEALGQKLTPIDESKFKSAMETLSTGAYKAKTGVKGIGDETRKVGDEVENTGKKMSGLFGTGGILGKVFQVNQITELAKNFAGGVSKLQEPLIEVDKQARFIGTLGVKNWKDFQDAALKAGMASGANFQTYVTAAYDAISAGAIKVKDGVADVAGGMDFLKQSAHLATVGMIDTKTTVNALTGVMNAYGASYKDTTKYTDTFTAAAQLGKTTIAELSNTLYNVVPTAASAGIGIQQVVAAIATLTKQGVPTAQATTDIRQAIVELMKPGQQLSVVMQKAGVSIESLKREGLQQSLIKVGNAMNDMGLKANQVYSSVEAAAAANLMMTKTSDGTTMSLSDLNYMMTKTAGTTEKGFEIMHGSIEEGAERMENRMKAFMASLTSMLGPELNTIFQQTTKAAPMVTMFAGMKTILPAEPFTKAGGLISGLGTQFGKIAVHAKNFGWTISSSLIPSLAAAGTAGVSSGAAIMAAWLPIIGIIAGVAALGVGVYALAGGFKKTTEEKIKDTEASINVIKQQQELNLKSQEHEKSNINLIASYEYLIKKREDLNKKGQDTKKVDEELNQVMNKLKGSYPDLIQRTDSHAKNLERVKNSTGMANTNTEKFTESNKKLVIEFENLNNKTNKTIEEKKRLTEVTNLLKKEFPGLIEGSNNSAQAISNLKIQTGLANIEMLKLIDSSSRQAKELKGLAITEAYQQVNKAYEQGTKQLTGFLGIAYSTQSASANKAWKEFYSNIKKTKDLSVLESEDFQNKMFDSAEKYTVRTADAFGKVHTEIVKFDAETTNTLKSHMIELYNAELNARKLSVDIWKSSEQKKQDAVDESNKNIAGLTIRNYDILNAKLAEYKKGVEEGTITKTNLAGLVKNFNEQTRLAKIAGEINAKQEVDLNKGAFQLIQQLRRDWKLKSDKESIESEKKLQDELVRAQKEYEKIKDEISIKSIDDEYKRALEAQKNKNIEIENHYRDEIKKTEKLEDDKSGIKKATIDKWNDVLKIAQENGLKDLQKLNEEYNKKEIEAHQKKNEELLNKEIELIQKRSELADIQLQTAKGDEYISLLETQGKLRLDLLNKQNEKEINELLTFNEKYAKALTDLIKLQVKGASPEEVAAQQELLNKAKAEAIEKDPGITNALNLQNFKYRKLTLDNENTIQEARLGMISDLAVRERELRINEARKVYKEELALAKGNISLEQQAFVKMQLAKGQAEQDYLRDYNKFYSVSLDLRVALAEEFSKKEEKIKDDAKIKDLEREKAFNERDLEDAKKALDRKEINTREYFDKVQGLLKEHNRILKDLQKENADDYVNVWEEAWNKVKSAMSTVFEKIKEDSLKINTDLADQTEKLILSRQKNEAKSYELLNKSILAGIEGRYEEQAKIDKEYIDLINENANNEIAIRENINKAWQYSGIVMGSVMAQSLLQNQSFIKSMVLGALSGLKSMAAIYIAEMTMKAIATNLIVGIFEAAGLSILIYGALAAAEAAVAGAKFKKGGFTGNISEEKEAGIVHGKEFVMNAKSTIQNINDYNILNRDNITIEEHVIRNRQDIIQNIIKEYRQKEVIKATSVFENLKIISNKSEVFNYKEIEIESKKISQQRELVQKQLVMDYERRERQVEVFEQYIAGDRKLQGNLLQSLEKQTELLLVENKEIRKSLKELEKNTKGLVRETRQRIQFEGTLRGDAGSIIGEIERAKNLEIKRS